MKQNQVELENFGKMGDLEQVDMHVHVHMHLTQKRHALTRKIETTITR